MKIKKVQFEGRAGKGEIYIRPDTTDMNIVKEVIINETYKKTRFGFQIEEGERWLDLGAHIGAFAIYCSLKGVSSVTCYEPMKSNYDMLVRNAVLCRKLGTSVFPRSKAITALRTNKDQQFWRASSFTNHGRGTLYPANGRLRKAERVPVEYARGLTEGWFDGIKMDIEGSEFGLIDNKLIPPCNKLCLEYHSWRDPSAENLKRRVEILRGLFREVNYVPELQRIMDNPKEKKPHCDRLIHCKGWRGYVSIGRKGPKKKPRKVGAKG